MPFSCYSSYLESPFELNSSILQYMYSIHRFPHDHCGKIPYEQVCKNVFLSQNESNDVMYVKIATNCDKFMSICLM